MHLVDIAPDDRAASCAAAPGPAQLRPHLTLDSFTAVYAEGHPQGLRFTAAYDDERCVGVAGWRIVATTQWLRKLYVDDLVTRDSDRSRGVGHRLLAELEERARSAGCHALDLDSGVQRFDAHRFYLRERMRIASHHSSRMSDSRGTGSRAAQRRADAPRGLRDRGVPRGRRLLDRQRPIAPHAAGA